MDPERARKKRHKKLIRWLLIDLAVAAIIFALLLHRPSRYDPVEVGLADHEPGQVSPYLTRLSAEYYNGAQRRRPFDLVVTEQGINEALAQSNWPVESEGIWFSAPAVSFVPGSIALMGTANVRGVDFVITIELSPKVDEGGRLNLQVTKVKIGAMNITPLAKMIAKKMYTERLAAVPVDAEHWRAKIAAALLNGEPFDPVFPAEDKNVRLDRVTVEQGRLILRLIPASRSARGSFGANVQYLRPVEHLAGPSSWSPEKLAHFDIGFGSNWLCLALFRSARKARFLFISLCQN